MTSPMGSDIRHQQSYVSLFSGIGGLEHSRTPAALYCEIDEACRTIISSRHATRAVVTHDDVRTLVDPPSVDFVVGGWPCQDLSIAGKQAGLAGERSGLFYEMLRIAQDADAHTIIGENVPNMLRIHHGADFKIALDAVRSAGFDNVAWRVLNARAFGLPQDRSRLFVVASRFPKHAMALHSDVPAVSLADPTPDVAGFYWTGGTHSICYSPGFVPAIKVGASDNRGRGTVAVFDGRTARKLTARESLRLQGLPGLPLDDVARSTVLRMAGNAVPLPVGNFVVDSVFEARPEAGTRVRSHHIDECGYLNDDGQWSIDHAATPYAANLRDFLDVEVDQPLSAQASAGLIVRVVRSGKPIPSDLFDVLFVQSQAGKRKRHPSRSDSLAVLDTLMPQVIAYRNGL